MIIKAKLHCNYDNVPYRIWINDELITERYYTCFFKKTGTVEENITLSNDLHVNLKDAGDYKIIVENLTNLKVKLIDYSISAGDIENENTGHM